MAKVIVAGGSGFIGSHLCEKLLLAGHKVTAVDNLITSSEKNIDSLKSNSNFQFLQQDIVNDLPEEIECEYIFHLASPASPNKKSPRSYINFPIETLLVNSQGTHKLLERAKRDEAKFLFTSTSEIYGDPQVNPQPETYNGNVNPNGLRSVYDEAKRFGEAITFGYRRKFGMDCRIIRIFNTYGPKMQKDDGRVVSNFINQAIKNEPITIYGDGSQTRSFCYVADMVDGIISAMFGDNTDGLVVNLGNPDERSVKDIAEIVKKMTNSSSSISYEELPEDDPKVRRPDVTRAKEKLGWEPKIGFEEGLKKTIEYFKSE